MNLRKKYCYALVLLISIAALHLFIACRGQKLPAWIIEDIHFAARDGLQLESYLLRPETIASKYPAVACFHQCWGNRDDYLKLLPYFAEAGIIAIVPNYPRLAPTLDKRRYTDLIDTLDYIESLRYVDKNRIGIISASLSVNVGLTAIRNRHNTIADVMLSGPVLDEASRKWITLNSDLAIFPITSMYDGNNYLYMHEYLARSLNPLSRHLFSEDTVNKFSIHAHGTFVFDEFPDSLNEIQEFYMDVFHITHKEHGSVKKLMPDFTISFPSTDEMPVIATFKQPANKYDHALILYPPRYQSRTYYDKAIDSFLAHKIAVLAPNTKRTCRAENKLFLCEKEIIGAVQFLRDEKKVKHITIVFPSFYFLAANYLAVNNKIPDAAFIFVETGDFNYGIEPNEITRTNNKIYYLKKMNWNAIDRILEKEL